MVKSTGECQHERTQKVLIEDAMLSHPGRKTEYLKCLDCAMLVRQGPKPTHRGKPLMFTTA
jgi:hypothetical protein